MSGVQQTGAPAPSWYRKHVAECFRKVLARIPGRKFATSTEAYVAQYCKLNGLINTERK